MSPSTVQIGVSGNRCESNRNQTGGMAYRLKRAILPAAISGPPAQVGCLLSRAKVESRCQGDAAPVVRKDRERDGHPEQNSAYSLAPVRPTPINGGLSSMAEHLIVDQGVVGSSPIGHPKTKAVISR